jgi:uncharacterized protein (TIGR00369 family)
VRNPDAHDDPMGDVEFVGGFAPFGQPEWRGIVAVRHQLGAPEQRPPIHHHAGIELAAVGDGEARFVLPVGPRWRDSTRAVPAAASVFLCDAPLGTAVLSLLGEGLTSPTAELSVFHLATGSGPTLAADARVVHLDGHTGYAECDIVDTDGTLVARATTRIAVTAVPPHRLPAPHPVPADFVPHHLRPVPEGVTTPWLDLHGIEVLSARIGEAILRMRTLGWHLSPSANLYGGTLGLLAQAATDTAASTTAPGGTTAIPYDLKVQYPRPIGPGATLTATARVVHAGRRTCFSEVLIHRDDGKLVTLGTASHGYR